MTVSFRNYSLCIPKEESATTVPGEKPIWIDVTEDRLLDALEFCRDQILNDRRNDLVVLYDRTLPEHLIGQVNRLKIPRTEGGFGWKKVVPWESFVGAECDTVIYVGTGSLEAFSRAKLKLMIITIAPSQGRSDSDSFTFDACLKKSVEKKLLQKQILGEKHHDVFEETVPLTSEIETTSDPQNSRLDFEEMLSNIHWR